MLVHAFVLSPLLLYLFDSFFVSRMYTCDKWVVPIMVIVVILLCFVPEMSRLYVRFLVFCLAFWIVVYWLFRGIGWAIRTLRRR
jgi:cobalamin synthase